MTPTKYSYLTDEELLNQTPAGDMSAELKHRLAQSYVSAWSADTRAMIAELRARLIQALDTIHNLENPTDA